MPAAVASTARAEERRGRPGWVDSARDGVAVTLAHVATATHQVETHRAVDDDELGARGGAVVERRRSTRGSRRVQQ